MMMLMMMLMTMLMIVLVIINDHLAQLADWRIRPLPDVMVKYAREDTHYLLYVYDCLRYELMHLGTINQLIALEKL